MLDCSFSICNIYFGGGEGMLSSFSGSTQIPPTTVTTLKHISIATRILKGCALRVDLDTHSCNCHENKIP